HGGSAARALSVPRTEQQNARDSGRFCLRADCLAVELKRLRIPPSSPPGLSRWSMRAARWIAGTSPAMTTNCVRATAVSVDEGNALGGPFEIVGQGEPHRRIGVDGGRVIAGQGEARRIEQQRDF